MIINREFTGDLFVMLVELDNLKSIIETFGHECGDLMIVDLSERLKRLSQPDVVVGRIGTDEFIVMVANSSEVTRYIAALGNLFEEPFSIMEKDVFAGFNIGIATFPQDGETIDSLLQHADIARANAKLSGKNRHCFYSRELWDHVQDRVALESALRKGLERNEFMLHYQPKVDARTRRMIGMEALIRWKPGGSDRLVSPVVFIPVLEDSGLITEVGAWVLETACRQHVEWRKQSMGEVRLSVNISAIQFNSGKLPELVKDVLERTSMAPQQLCLELTESIVVKDINDTIATLKQLAALGIKLSIDDFGTGYSSLSYLKDMPIDELKIDRSFVMNLPGDSASVAIVESVLAMSKGMNLTVVAEGVETIEQADFLASRGCHELQGYLFSKPLAKEDLFVWCRGTDYCDEHRA
jgi:diguanylate cyclase (GGDEF)-like protein